jgi:transposase
MSREIAPDYETQYLFPRSLEEWVGPDHPARFIREFVDAIDLDALGLSEEERIKAVDPNGRPHYGVRLLLKVWLYGYMNRIRSSRGVESACRDLLPMVWLAGTHVPDHNTLWRFWSRYRETVRQLFLQSVRVAMQENLLGMVLHAVDGTKLKSAASKRSAWHAEDLVKLLEHVEAQIGDLEQQIASAGAGDDGADDSLPAVLQDREQLRSRIKSALATLASSERKHMHPLDPEAEMMRSEGRTTFAYNAQAVVDQKSSIIVAADVSTEANDEHQLEPMLAQVNQNVDAFAATTVADSGYHTVQSLVAAAGMGADVLVAVPQKEREVGPYHTMRFCYEPDSDTVVCPEGQRLEREGTRRHKQKPYALKTYRCRLAASCPVASECSRDPKGRVIEISPHHDVVLRNRTHPNARALLKLRQTVVERVFAEIKETMSMRRWSVRGLAAVRTQWFMICTALNLRRTLATRRS